MVAKRAKTPEWKYIDTYDLLEYRCGLRAGDYVRLRRDLAITDWEGHPTGKVYPAGQVWKVLPGASEDPGVVFLLQSDHERCTWDDTQSIYEMFELIERNRAAGDASADT